MTAGAERWGVRTLRTLIRTPVFYHRIVVLLCAVAVSAPLIYKSRPGGVNATPAAFSVTSSTRGYVRISGDVRHAGIYPISVNSMTMTAIKMAEPVSADMNGISEAEASAYLENGTALQIDVDQNGRVQLKREQMPAKERIVMGIPLDIATMSEADFDALPGIGPVMARRIVAYRQNNGGMMKVPDLLSIEGIGEKRYKQLLKYF